MTNIQNFITAFIEAAAEYISTKPRVKCRIPWDSVAIREKRDSTKMASLLNKRNPTNVHAQKLQKAPRELVNTY